MVKLYKIKILKDTEKCKIGEIVEATKKNAESYIKNGYAIYIKKEKKQIAKEKTSLEEITKLIPSWADKWNNPTEKAKILIELKDISNKSDLKISDLKNLISTEINNRKEKNKQDNEIKKVQDKTEEQKKKELDKNIKEEEKAKKVEEERLKEEEERITRKQKEAEVLQLKANKVFNRKSQIETFQELQPYFYDKVGLWWLWKDDKYKWEIADEVEILNMIEGSTGQDIITSKARTELLNLLKQEGRKNSPQPIEKTWIQFKDKIFDVITGEEFDASPKYFVTNPIPWETNKDKFIETPIMDKIFNEWVGEKYKETLYQILAYSLLPDYPIHRLFCFIGAGLNGKSCFLRLLKKFVGIENVTATELDVLLNSRFEVTRLFKKLVCQMGETNFAEFSKTSIIKKLTGQDVMGFEYKNKTPFESDNYAKIIIATNNLPATTDKTIGFYRRWCIIDFPNQFSEEKDILADIPDEEYKSLALKSVLILKDLLSERKFKYEGTIEERQKKYEDRSNPFEKFLKEYVITEAGDSFIFKWEFEQKLNEWAKENRFRAISDITINQKMKELSINDGRTRVNIWNKDKNEFVLSQVRVWDGIKWNNKMIIDKSVTGGTDVTG